METTIEALQDSFRISFNAYEDSRIEAEEVINLYHNRQYSDDQLATLENRGQPAETFNVIKLFANMLLGYYSTVVNTVTVSPRQYNDILNASLLNDVFDYTMRDSDFETEGDKIKLDGLLAGLMCVYEEVVDTKEKDQFGRIIRETRLSHVPQAEIALDPMSRLENYSDAGYIHRWKWVSEDKLKEMFKKKKNQIEQLEAYENHLNIDDSEFERTFGTQFQGIYKRYNNYLLVHSVVIDKDERRWSIYWCADTELDRQEITFKEVKFPYRVQKIHVSDRVEYYGMFRECIESQKAINQAILKIQLMANTQKALVEKGGVEDIDSFTDMFNRVNAIIPVLSLKKIKIENLTKEVVDQYTIVDRALTRIQRVLGINDSFLGMAFASDSGRKVKLQQNQTTMSLRPLTVRFQQFYRLLGWDVCNLIKQYYTAYQVLRITDETIGSRWSELNKPMTIWTGKFDQAGQPIMDMVWEEVLDPASGKPMKDDEGNLIIAPVPTAETEVAFTKFDIEIDSVAYNDEDEKNQLMLENVLQGNIGSMLSSINPAGFLQAAALAIRSMKTKHSLDISDILMQTAQGVSQQGNVVPQEVPATTPKKSESLKLPTNTNRADR